MKQNKIRRKGKTKTNHSVKNLNILLFILKNEFYRNEGLLRNNPEVKIDEIQDRRRQSQSAAEDMDKNGVLFFGQMSEVAIGCLDTKTHPNYDNEIFDKTIIDPETLQYTSGVKVSIYSTNFYFYKS